MSRTGPTGPGSGGKSSAYPGYRNPFRKASVTPARIDMGVDYLGRPGDPVYAIGNGRVVEVWDSGVWPGSPGGFVGYQLSDGPEQGRIVYVAEDIAPQVSMGQQVTPNTVVARFGSGQNSAYGSSGPGLETGWGSPGLGAHTEAAALNEWNNTNSTEQGITFSNLILSLGGPAGIPNYPARGPNDTVSGIRAGKGGPTGGPGSSGGGGSSNPDCLIGFPSSTGIVIPFVGSLGKFGGGCILSRSGARAVIGAGILVAGGGLFLVGTLILAAYGLKGSGAGGKAGQAAGNALEATGAVVALVPGGEPAGAVVAASGHAAKQRGKAKRVKAAAGVAKKAQAARARS